jgi:hypothetical protein
MCKHRFMSCCVLLLICVAAAHAQSSGPAARRQQLLEHAGDPSAVSALAAALNDDNAVVRRTALRLLADMPSAAHDHLVAALGNDDVVVCRGALRALVAHGGLDALPYLTDALASDDVFLRQMAVTELISLERTIEVNALLEKAQGDSEPAVRNPASRAMWPFHRNVIPLTERKDYDHEVHVVQTIALPVEGWKFKLDPQRNGHLTGVFAVDHDDASWDDVAIEQVWQNAGYDYIGVTWYRRDIDLPAAPPKHNGVEMVFGAVDESAWVWVNGEYAGAHDVGPSGWNERFRIDITPFVRWGEPNQITVRAMNTAHAGGIWKPVTIEIVE